MRLRLKRLGFFKSSKLRKLQELLNLQLNKPIKRKKRLELELKKLGH